MNNQVVTIVPLIDPTVTSVICTYLLSFWQLSYSLAHAYDLRSLTCDVRSSERQAAIINDFLMDNFLQLNADKCKLIVYTHMENPRRISQ